METLGLRPGDKLKVLQSYRTDLRGGHDFEVLRKEPALPNRFAVDEYYFEPAIAWDNHLKKISD